MIDTEESSDNGSFKEEGEDLGMAKGKKCKTVNVKGHFKNVPGRQARKRIPAHTRKCPPPKTNYSISVPKKPKKRRFRDKW